MKFLEGWTKFLESLSTTGGELLVLVFILFFFLPCMNSSPECEKAGMFVLGAIVGLVRNKAKGD
jgi:hypothetical protein